MTLPSSIELRRALSSYPAVVERQGVERLPDLDRWYRDELPQLLVSRSPSHITISELSRVTEWKMARGVWRGRNLALVRSNDPAEVETISAEALAEVPHPRKPIARLSTLKGVGAATASAVTAAAAPDVYPFFDELVAEQLPGLGSVAWTLGYYVRYADTLRDTAREMGDGWSPALLERALWAHVGGKAGKA